ncbi:MAG: DUF6029 family protein, partial [Bacteroidota bacterium]|nr:DUF6029 family protein [Bacteroidota bacterium]
MTANRTLITLIYCLSAFVGWSQDPISLSGSLESNVNFYMRDEQIGAANTPQYEHQQIGTDNWLTLRAQL